MHDMWGEVFSFLSLKDLVSVGQVCREFNTLAKHQYQHHCVDVVFQDDAHTFEHKLRNEILPSIQDELLYTFDIDICLTKHDFTAHISDITCNEENHYITVTFAFDEPINLQRWKKDLKQYWNFLFGIYVGTRFIYIC